MTLARLASATAIVAATVVSIGIVAPASTGGRQAPQSLWVDVTAGAIGATRHWTNKVEIADLNQDGRPDLLFANGGDYSAPGAPEPSQVFFHTGDGARFAEATARVLGARPISRVSSRRAISTATGSPTSWSARPTRRRAVCTWVPDKGAFHRGHRARTCRRSR